MYPSQPPKNPALAAILSFLINGLGQIYNGETKKGLIIIGVQIINALLALIIIGFFTGLIVFVWSIYDAYKTAEKINAQAHQEAIAATKVCPRCAERVNSGAQVCHHCGFAFISEQPMLTASSSVVLPAASTAPSTLAPSLAAGAKFCSNCGRRVKSDARFCLYCRYQIGS